MTSLDAMLSWVTKRKGGRAVVGAAVEVWAVPRFGLTQWFVSVLLEAAVARRHDAAGEQAYCPKLVLQRCHAERQRAD